MIEKDTNKQLADEVKALREELHDNFLPLLQQLVGTIASAAHENAEATDALYAEVCVAVQKAGSVSTTFLQEMFGVGYARAARLIDLMRDEGLIRVPAHHKIGDIFLATSAIESLKVIEEQLTAKKTKEKKKKS